MKKKYGKQKESLNIGSKINVFENKYDSIRMFNKIFETNIPFKKGIIDISSPIKGHECARNILVQHKGFSKQIVWDFLNNKEVR